MDSAGPASTDRSQPSTGCLERSLMNKLTRYAYPLIALLSIAAAFTAHAESPARDDGSRVAATSAPSAKSRAQVLAELAQARADGSLEVYSIDYNPLRTAKTTLTREEVRAQASVARVTQPAGPFYGEDSGSFYLARLPVAVNASRAMAAAKAGR
jgi:hypothetical protein